MVDPEELDAAECEDSDWFGETSPFENEAQLASALPLILMPAPADDMAEAVAPEPVPDADAPAPDAEPEAAGHGALLSHAAHIFEVVDPRLAAQPQDSDDAVAFGGDSAGGWSVRVPGVEPLPQRLPGRSGWSIRNSVRILRRAEDLIFRLRQEAVVAAFDAAARALRERA